MILGMSCRRGRMRRRCAAAVFLALCIFAAAAGSAAATDDGASARGGIAKVGVGRDAGDHSAAEHMAKIRIDKNVLSAENDMTVTDAEHRVFIGDEPLACSFAEIVGEAYVFADFFGCLTGGAVIDEDESGARVAAEGFVLDAVCGDEYITVNGRCLWCEGGVASLGGRCAVPLSAAAGALSMSVRREGDCYYCVGDPSPITSGDEFYDDDDLLWLSRIISCESESEELLGKIAVGNVVLNRVESPDFPGDVEGVVFDDRYGIVQFSPVAGGYIYRVPDDESVVAAKLCLEGVTVSDEIMYFMNPALSSTTWISDNRPYVMTIGRHSFYS